METFRVAARPPATGAAFVLLMAAGAIDIVCAPHLVRAEFVYPAESNHTATFLTSSLLPSGRLATRPLVQSDLTNPETST